MGIGITLNRYSLESFPLPYIKNGTLDLFVVTGDNDSEEVIAESKVFIESLHAFAPNDTSVINRTFSSLNDIEKKSKNLIIIGTVENNTWSNPLMQEIWQNHSNETVTFGNESGNIKILDKDGKIVENNISERTHYALISTIRDNNRQIMLVGGLDSNATIAALKAMTNESKKNDIFGKGGRGVVINWTDVNNNSIIEIPEIRITLPAPTPAFPFVPITPPNEPPEPPEQPTTFQSAPQLTIGKPYQNAVFEVMEYISNVFGGNTINHSFKNMKTDILNISFYALFTPKYLLMKVQVLNNTPDNISAPSGKIYKNLNIFLEGLSKKHVKNVKINFRVEKSWISDNNINSATIQLVRYNISKWEPLITKKTSTDNEYEYYEAQSPGFSLFAITGETVLVTFSQEQPSLIFAENYFYVAYNSNEKGNNDIFIKKYDFNWNLIKKKQITTGNGSQWAPSIEFANNHLYVAYDSAETGNSEVFIKIYDQDLNYIDKKQITNNEKSEEEYPSLCKHNNILYIAYASDESGDSEIFLERYDLNLNPIR
ncbi:MAG: PGF-pre-PGF domain-containing protein, partial [Methanosarcinales archaeon]